MRLSRRMTLNGKKAPPGTLYLFDGGPVNGFVWAKIEQPVGSGWGTWTTYTGSTIKLDSQGAKGKDRYGNHIDYEGNAIRIMCGADLRGYATLHYTILNSSGTQTRFVDAYESGNTSSRVVDTGMTGTLDISGLDLTRVLVGGFLDHAPQPDGDYPSAGNINFNPTTFEIDKVWVTVD